ncbi:MAG: hypothetical protein IH604_04585 [Burkholderiales bacterium]|nr:hypothetical protein [Burkholderiales bacterium]
MSENKAKLSRRNFLLTVGASSAAGAAAVVASAVPRAQPVVVAGDKRRSKGYEATAHVRNYYRTAKV